MGHYRRGQRLYISYKDELGKWRDKRTPYMVGDEEKAESYYRAVVREMDHRRTVGIDGPATVASYAKVWIAEREKRGLDSARDDKTRLNKHVIPAIGTMYLNEVRPRDVRRLVLDLRAKKTDKGKPKLAPRTVRHIYAALRAMCKSAIIDEHIAATPCVLEAGILPKKVDKDPEWRASAIFTRGEVERIISANPTQMLPDRRVLYSLLFLGAVRFGEAAALRWRHYDRTLEPLGKLLVAHSYNVKTKKVKGVKTDVPRQVPVHPTLAAILAEWRMTGFSALFGRPPTDDDLIVPSRRLTDPSAKVLKRYGDNYCRSANHMLKRFHEDLDTLKIRRRRQHDARRTFISLALADGARRDLLEIVTHGPKGDIMSLYTTIPWAALCDEVAKLNVRRIKGAVAKLELVD